MAASAALAIPLSATAAPTPTEVAVYPADQGTQVLTDKIIFGGTTGYLHQPQGTTTYVWTTYGTGQNRVITGLPNGLSNPWLAGADRMAYTTATGLAEVDLAGNTSETFALPTGAVALGVSDNRVLVRADVNNTLSFGVLTFANDGSFTSAIVASPPNVDPALGTLVRPTGDPSSQVVTYGTASHISQFALLDLATATAHIIPGVASSHPRAAVSADHVAIYDLSAKTAQFYDRADIVAGTQAPPPSIPMPLTITQLVGGPLGLVGDELVIRSAVAPFPVNGLRPDGSLEELVPSTQASSSVFGQALTADGDVLAVGGTSPSDWAVRRLSEGSDGTVQDTAVQTLHSMVNAGVTISHGQVRHVDLLPDLGVTRAFAMFGHDLLDPNGVSATLPPPSGLMLPPVATCAPNVACVIPYDDGDGVLLITANNVIAHVFSTVNTIWVSVPPGSSLGGGSSNDYVIINNPGTLKQYVTPTNLVLPPARPLTAAAVSFDTLWSSSAAGLLTSTDLRTNASRLVRTGGSCRPQDVQATQRWVYWSCGGNAAAGVIDLQTHATFSVPSGRALLGDGYLVRHLSDGSLVLTDFHSDASSGSVTLANVPQGPLSDDRNVTFSVDPFDGDVAYVDASNSAHVIDPNVP